MVIVEAETDLSRSAGLVAHAITLEDLVAVRGRSVCGRLASTLTVAPGVPWRSVNPRVRCILCNRALARL